MAGSYALPVQVTVDRTTGRAFVVNRASTTLSVLGANLG